MAFDANGRTNCSGTPTICHVLWFETTDEWVTATPAVANNVVYVVPNLGGLLAYDTTDSSHPLLWSADQGAGNASPTVAGGVVYAGSSDGRLSAFDAAGQTNCSLTQFGLQFCQPLWTATLDGALNTVAVAGSTVYALSRPDTLYAFDAAGETGCTGTPKVCAPLWTAPPPDSTTTSSSAPVVSGGRVYTTDQTRRLRVFDAAGGTSCSGHPVSCTPLWTAQIPSSAGASALDAPAVANDRVYVGNAVYDATGASNCSGTPVVCTPLWTVAGGGRLPIVANGIEFVGGAMGAGGTTLPLAAFDATGAAGCSGTPVVCEPLWTVDPGGEISGSPAIVNGVLYVTTSGANELDLRALHAYAP